MRKEKTSYILLRAVRVKYANSYNYKCLIGAIILLVFIAGCKKNKVEPIKKQSSNTSQQNGNTSPVSIVLPDSVMFVSKLDTGVTIYLLNASTGSLITKYHYPSDSITTWCSLSAGNGFLYEIENNKINAINMTTGAILWTDRVNNYTVPG